MHKTVLYVIGRGRLAQAVLRTAAAARVRTATQHPGVCDPEHTVCVYLARSGKRIIPEELPRARTVVTLTTGQLTSNVGVPSDVDAHVAAQLATYRGLKDAYGDARVGFIRSGRLFATHPDGLDGASRPLVHAWASAICAGADIPLIDGARERSVYWHSVETAACALVGLALDDHTVASSGSPFSDLHVPAVGAAYGWVVDTLARAHAPARRPGYVSVPGAVGEARGAPVMYSTDVVEWLYQLTGVRAARAHAPMTSDRLTAELRAHFWLHLKPPYG